jgi:GLPGLI family protein
MKRIGSAILTLLLPCCLWAQDNVKTIADCTIRYSFLSSDSTTADSSLLRGIGRITYVKANLTRTDVIGPNYLQSLVIDTRGDSGFILKEIGQSKYITDIRAEEWKMQQDRFKRTKVQVFTDTLNILGYTCRKAQVSFNDSTVFTYYYTTELKPAARGIQYFKDIDGFVLRFETERNGRFMVFQARELNLLPVPASRFDRPVRGYRIYDKNKDAAQDNKLDVD